MSDRGVGDILSHRWDEEQATLESLLCSVKADENAHTIAIKINPLKISSTEEFLSELKPKINKDGYWSFLTESNGKGQLHALAIPLAKNPSVDEYALIIYIEMHTQLIAWWLMYSWRAQQLIKATTYHADAGDVISAAACARPLVETAAAFWSDAKKISSLWNEMKLGGSPLSNIDAANQRNRMNNLLTEIFFGSKFIKTSKENEDWNHIDRLNVVTQVEKLGKVLGVRFMSDYEWLCNTVHPSIGNMLAFTSPWLMHSTNTHAIKWFAGRPIRLEGGPDNSTHAERTVQMATARAVITSLEVISTTLDATLHIIDDVGLTTSAPTLARDPYWRKLRKGYPNSLCPCRSGRKTRWCRHVWGESAPPFPDPPIRTRPE